MAQPEIALTNPDGLLTPSQHNDIADTVRAVGAALEGNLKLPTRLELILEHTGHEPRVDPDTLRVTVPYHFAKNSMRFPRGYGLKHPKYSRYHVAHEYGHVLFAVNRDAKLLETLQETRKKIDRLGEEVPGLSSRVTKLVLEDAFANRAEIKKLGARLREILAEQERLGSLMRYEIGTQEVFSDMMEVILTGDGRAPRDSLRFTGTSERHREMAEMRDFTKKVSPTGWKEAEVHHLYTPVRNHIWRYYLDNATYRRQWGLVAARVLTAMNKEIVALSKRPDYHALSPEVLNRRLINAIDFEFGNLN